ncbi:MAG TPA: bifunctional 5,10-methylenetetrahydrofolate dehydrogenase/5,10-methenyltetrahydrofolate cyclohydrolase [Thermoplasmata archaeon]|nr:bifunctional 5,10-methylenetetrahydrofolate dehydrogenase/5,10-methenyltetrahydrofolate cyclohydrolase [Thermoplasmata archaeon]
MTVRLEGAPVAERLGRSARDLVASLGGRPPLLVSLHRSSPTPYAFYLRQQAKAAERAGVALRPEALPQELDRATLRERLRSLDREPQVDAVLLEHPLPPSLDFHGAVGALSPEKDVDGVGAENVARLISGAPLHYPAVVRAALAIAEFHGIGLSRRRVGVVGRSPTVGWPMALALASPALGHDATVTLAHSKTPDLAGALSGAEVVFSCVGRPKLLDRTNVPKGCAVIDVGLSSVPDPSKPSGHRAVGDADADALEGWASALTPVPGGVGPVTSAALMLGVAESRRARAPLGKGAA